MDKTEELARRRDRSTFGADEARRVGRGASRRELLDDDDANIGNGQNVFPQPGATLLVDPSPPRLLALDALSTRGRMASVVMTNRFATQDIPNPPFSSTIANGIGGPIVGIVEFGNGNVFTRVEVDVPMGRLFVNSDGTVSRQAEDGGTIVSVPAGTLRVYARNDGNLVPSTIRGDNSANAFVGPPLASATISDFGARPTFVQAHTDYYTRTSLKTPTRTVYVYVSPGAAQVLTPVLGGLFPIPPFARAVRLLRSPMAADPTILFFSAEGSAATVIDSATVAAGATSPVIEVPGNALWFTVSTTVGVTRIAAEFQINV